MSRPDTVQHYPYAEGSYPEDSYPGNAEEEQESRNAEEEQESRKKAPKRQSVDSWMDQESRFLPGVKRRKIALFLLRLPALIPLIFTLRGWLSLNEKLSLTNTEADVLGTGGEYCFLLAVSITPLMTLTGQRWFAPLRRWYGIMFAVIGITDSVTASITGAFSGGPIGRVAGHSFLLAGFLVILLALPVLATANTPMQRASPANRALTAEVDGYAHNRRGDLAAARSDLTREVKTLGSFDDQLATVSFPSAAATAAGGLIQADQKLAKLTGLQARAPSLRKMRSFDRRVEAAAAVVETQAGLIRRALGLPPSSGPLF